jgi:hypothetical protein
LPGARDRACPLPGRVVMVPAYGAVRQLGRGWFACNRPTAVGAHRRSGVRVGQRLAGISAVIGDQKDRAPQSRLRAPEYGTTVYISSATLISSLALVSPCAFPLAMARARSALQGSGARADLSRANAIILLFSADVFSAETESHDPAQQPLEGRGPAQQPQHPQRRVGLAHSGEIPSLRTLQPLRHLRRRLPAFLHRPQVLVANPPVAQWCGKCVGGCYASATA